MKLTMTLENQQLFSIEKLGKINLKCISGHLWVTTDENSTDMTLRGGENVSINTKGKLVVQGIINSKISINS